MFDRKQLEEYLKALITATPDGPRFLMEPPKSSLARMMDRYDLGRVLDYRNVSTEEFPLYARREALVWDTAAMYMPVQYGTFYPTYGGISRPFVSWLVNGFNVDPVDAEMPKTPPPPPPETPHDRLKRTIARLSSVAPVRVEDPTPAMPKVAPDCVQTLIGWRAWDAESGVLSSIGSSHFWEPKKAQHAQCRDEFDHPAPQKNCRCGYWCFKSLDLLLEALGGYTESISVVGTVEIWGRVIECENGFRAEYAYPKELWLLRNGLEHLGWKYGVPVKIRPKETAPTGASTALVKKDYFQFGFPGWSVMMKGLGV